MDVVYVDQNDQEVGFGSIANAINNGFIVRIARVFIFNSKGQVLIQKRSDSHKSLPGRWDQTAAGHVDKGETYDQAAARELFEEMGIKGVRLNEVGKFYSEDKDELKVKKRFNAVYSGVYDGEVRIDNHEVSDFRWIMTDELKDEMKNEPDEFTEGFILAFKFYLRETKAE